MLTRIVLIFSFISYGFAYYTLPGKCPDIQFKDGFKLAEFLGTWYQVGHYSSDGRRSNCSVIDLTTKKDGIYMKLTRVESGIFKRFSEGKIGIPSDLEDGAFLEFKTEDPTAARRVSKRDYPFWIVATNYNYYAVAYTCQYSELMNKHYVYTWLLSRTKSLNAVSTSLALDAAKRITRITSEQFLDDSFNEGCGALDKVVKEEDSHSTSHPAFNFPVIL